MLSGQVSIAISLKLDGKNAQSYYKSECMYHKNMK